MPLHQPADGSARSRTPRFRLLLAAATVWAALTCCSAVRAQGIFLTGTGPVNQSMGGASVAAPLDSCGAINWNPAAIGGLKCSDLEFGLGLVLPSESVSSSALGVSGSTTGNPGVTPVPNMSFVNREGGCPWTWGIGIYGIGGFSSNYPASATFGSNINPILTPQLPFGIGVGRVYADAEIYQVTPTVALEVADHFFVGLAPTLDLAKIEADPLLLAPINFSIFDQYGPGDGTQYAMGGGFQAGMYYESDLGWNFGASYKSTQWFQPLRYNSNDSSGAPVYDKVAFELPSIVSLGTAFTGWERFVLAADVRYIMYNDAEGFKGSGFEPNYAVVGLGWQNVWEVATGVQYCATDRLKLRCGYTWVENPVPAADTEFNIGTSLIMTNFASVGGSYMIRDGVMVNIAYTHGFRATSTGPFVEPIVGPIPGTEITTAVSADHLTMGLAVQF